MDKPKGEFSTQTKKAIKDELHAQLKPTFGRFENAAKIYTQHIFIVNAGGSAATLAFLGTKTGSSFAIWPLLFFAAGVIACGFKLLAAFYLEKRTFYLVLNLGDKFSKTNKIEDLYPKEGEMEKWTSCRIGYWASFIAHGLFIAGVIAGGFAYLWSP